MKKPTFVVYRAKDGWRWHLLARNNRIIAESGEAYTRRHDVYRALDAVHLAIFDGNVKEKPAHG